MCELFVLRIPRFPLSLLKYVDMLKLLMIFVIRVYADRSPPRLRSGEIDLYCLFSRK